MRNTAWKGVNLIAHDLFPWNQLSVKDSSVNDLQQILAIKTIIHLNRPVDWSMLCQSSDFKEVLVSAGGDHTIAYPILQAVAEK